MPCARSEDGTLAVCLPPGAQPAVGAVLRGRLGDERVERPVGWKPGQLAWCRVCLRRRRLRNLMVVLQMWYDPSFFCADPEGCRRAKRKRNARRNAAARARYARRKAEKEAR